MRLGEEQFAEFSDFFIGDGSFFDFLKGLAIEHAEDKVHAVNTTFTTTVLVSFGVDVDIWISDTSLAHPSGNTPHESSDTRFWGNTIGVKVINLSLIEI